MLILGTFISTNNLDYGPESINICVVLGIWGEARETVPHIKKSYC